MSMFKKNRENPEFSIMLFQINPIAQRPDIIFALSDSNTMQEELCSFTLLQKPEVFVKANCQVLSTANQKALGW